MGASLIQPYYVKDEGFIGCKLLYVKLSVQKAPAKNWPIVGVIQYVKTWLITVNPNQTGYLKRMFEGNTVGSL
jgi:hypothetical protein